MAKEKPSLLSRMGKAFKAGFNARTSEPPLSPEVENALGLNRTDILGTVNRSIMLPIKGAVTALNAVDGVATGAIEAIGQATSPRFARDLHALKDVVLPVVLGPEVGVHPSVKTVSSEKTVQQTVSSGERAAKVKAVEKALDGKPAVSPELTAEPTVHAVENTKAPSTSDTTRLTPETQDAAISVTEPVPPAPVQPVDAPALNLTALRKQLNAAPSPKDKAAVIDNAPLNVAKLNTDDDVKNVFSDIKALYGEAYAAPLTEVQTFKQTQQLADTFAEDPASLVEALKKFDTTADNLPASVLAGRKVLTSVAEELVQQAKAYNLDGSEESLSALMKASDTYSRLMGLTKNVQTAAARTVSAGRIEADSAGVNLAQVTDAVNDFKIHGVDAKEVAKRLATFEDNPTAAGRFLSMLRRYDPTGITENPVGVLNELYINSILSGPNTLAVNLISNTTETLFKPIERALGGVLTGQPHLAREAANIYKGMVYEIGSSLDAAAVALQSDNAILDAVNTTTDLADTKVIKGALGTAIRLPTRLLTGTDEAFKQLNYRAVRFSEGIRNAPADLSDSERVEWARKYVDAGFDVNGKATDEKALKFSREATFTESLAEGSFSQSIQQVVTDHPALRFVLPFIRTPTNLVTHSFQRLPGVGLLSGKMRDDIAAGGVRQAEAIGKQALGGLFAAGAVIAAQANQVTGGGPADPELKKQLMDTGWRPYSIRIEREDGTVEYVPYDRLDPRMRVFGIAADLWSVTGSANDDVTEDLYAGLMVAIANNVVGKTYLRGISQAMTALTSKDPNTASRFIGNTLSGFVPYSSALRQVGAASNLDDPYLHEIETAVDVLKTRIPGLSGSLPPVRNVLGEPLVKQGGFGVDALNPFAGSKYQNDKVKDELFLIGQIGGRIFKNPPATQDGIDLKAYTNDRGQTAYDRWLELSGTLELDGKPLKARLEAFINSPDYQALPFNDDNGLPSRASVLAEVITSYRRIARAQVNAEFPQITEDILASRRSSLTDRLDGSGPKTLEDFLK